MGSDASLDNEGPLEDLCRVCGHPWERHTAPPQGEESHSFAPVCSSVHGQGEHCFHYGYGGRGGKCCSCATTCEAPESEGSASASPDELCQCGHARKGHSALSAVGCAGCAPFSMGKHAFMPRPEAPECEHPEGCPYKGGCMEFCAFGAQLKGIRMMPRPEPEAPEWSTCSTCGHDKDVHHGKDMWLCSELGCPCEGFTLAVPKATESPRRPPYAVAYALQGGAQYEIALPGDATVRAEDGALIITHSSAVLAMTQYRPMEGQ